MAAIRGDGSFVWLTVAALQGVRLGELPALRAPDPFSPMTQHSIRVAGVRPSLDDTLPVAVVVARGLAKPRRERAALKGWQASIAAGRYAHVRYPAGPGVADHLRRLATASA